MVSPSACKSGISTVPEREEAVAADLITFAGKREFNIGEDSSKSLTTQMASDSRQLGKVKHLVITISAGFRVLHLESTFRDVDFSM